MVRVEERFHNRSNNYWKLKRYQDFLWDRTKLRARLNQKAHLSSVSKPRLVELCHRQERGLIIYEGCKEDELQTFCSQRRIPVDKRMSKKADLISLLEAADDGPSFDHFADLPPELRDFIYQLHFESLQPTDGLARPPITQVSRLIRQESLPTFYKKSAFKVKIQVYEVLSPSTRTFIAMTPTEQIELISKLSIGGSVMGPPEYATWLVDLSPSAKQSITSGSPDEWFPIDVDGDERMKKRLRPIVENLRRKSKLTKGDFEAFVKAFQGTSR